MAQVIGDLRRRATSGERKVLELLRSLSDDYIVWPERHIERYPDFIVLHPEIGILVLEVKDWVYIEEANPDSFLIETHKGEKFRAPNPHRETWEKALAISDKLQEGPDLKHMSGPFQGKLIFPWGYATIFTRLTPMQLRWLSPVLPPEYAFCEDDLRDTTFFEYRLRHLPKPFKAKLTPAQVDLVRMIIYPELKAPSRHPSARNHRPGILDISQEQAARTGLGEVWENEVTARGENSVSSPLVRLIRGVAGSGKTLVLTLRAKLLCEYHPDWRILVVTFNKALAERLKSSFQGWEEHITVNHFHMLCKELLVDADWWVHPIEDRHGRIVNALNKLGYTDKLDVQFLQDEFEWIKDYQVLDRGTYLETPRVGRKKSLGKADRELVFDVFEEYQSLLHRNNREDWAGIPFRVLEAIQQGAISVPQFDAVLIDEAQDFAPAWFEVLKSLLNSETGIMYMAADSTQRIYRKVSWKSLGLNVVGRSRVLRRTYRNTYEIALTAYELISQNEHLLQELRDDEDGLLEPDFDTRSMPHGDYPVIANCKDVEHEYDFVAAEIQRLLQFGYDTGEILILCRRAAEVTHCLTSLRAHDLPGVHLKEDSSSLGKSISVGTLHAAKGLEYRVVFILHLDSLFQYNGAVTSSDTTMIEIDELRLLYVGMTRARERLYLSFKRHLPESIQYLARYITHHTP